MEKLPAVMASSSHILPSEVYTNFHKLSHHVTDDSQEHQYYGGQFASEQYSTPVPTTPPWTSHI